MRTSGSNLSYFRNGIFVRLNLILFLAGSGWVVGGGGGKFTIDGQIYNFVKSDI